jgi:hypothetical protein
MSAQFDRTLLLIILKKLLNSCELCDLFTGLNQRLQVRKKIKLQKKLVTPKRVLNSVTKYRIKLIYN